MIKKILILAIIITSIHASVSDFNEQIANQIFSKNEPYLIFVTTSTDSQILNEFQAYCLRKTNCTILPSSNEQYEHITSFIGYEGNNYFLILDAHQHLKYILAIDQTIDDSQQNNLATALSNFQAQFQAGDLAPFFASEDPDEQVEDERCTKLVGKTYERFLVQDEPVKIVYLYTKSEFCEACQNFLERFKSIAQKYFERNVIRFGFIDVLKNDNRFIKDEIIPYFLIYVHENFDDPYGVGADEFEQLEQYVVKLIQDVKGSRYRQDMNSNYDDM